MREIIIKLDGNELNIKGEHIEEERDEQGYVVFPASFEIESIESLDKDIYELLEYISLRGMTYIQTIEEKVLDVINNE